MYTEDDEKVKVKKSNSNNDDKDFYTSFSEMDENEGSKSSRKKNNRRREVEVKEEADYSNFYDSNDEEEENEEDNGNKGKWIKIGAIVLLALLLIGLIIFLITRSSGTKGDIELTNNDITLKVGESDYVSYKIVDTENEVTSTFSSSNSDVAIVDENGAITAMGPGEATITISYTIDGKTKQKTCKVTVTGDPTPTPKPTAKPTATPSHNIKLNLKFNNGSDNHWTNKDVAITVEASSDYGISSIKYAVNCSGTCDYKDLSGNTINVSNNGTTKITVLATDKNNQQAKKEVTVKIDKEAPNVTYNGNTNIVSQGEVEVCVTCSDSISGCTKSKVCKKYTSSQSNQVLTVSDNAGNKKSSPTFNVSINKVQQPCSLSVASDGTVTATLREEATYSGFNSSYSGSNETSKKIDVSVTTTDQAGVMAGAKVVYYYVKNKNGGTGKCFVTVIKECKCNDATSTDPKCPGTCTFRPN